MDCKRYSILRDGPYLLLYALLCTQDQDSNVDAYLVDVDRVFQSIKVCVTVFFLLNKIR